MWQKMLQVGSGGSVDYEIKQFTTSSTQAQTITFDFNPSKVIVVQNPFLSEFGSISGWDGTTTHAVHWAGTSYGKDSAVFKISVSGNAVTIPLIDSALYAGKVGYVIAFK